MIEETNREFTRELAVKLDDNELQSYGKQLADRINEEKLLEDRKKQSAAEWSAKIKAVTIEISRLASARANGEELRPVKCYERLKGNVIEIVRIDRDQVVDTRPAEMRDLQTTIPGTDEEYVAPSGFDEGPRDMGPQTEPSNVVQGNFGGTTEDDDLNAGEAPTGTVYDADGNAIGSGVESSTGGGVYVSGEQPCAACGVTIGEDEKTSKLDGCIIHTACEPEDLSEVDRANARAHVPDTLAEARLPTPTMSATIGEQTAEKKKAEKPKRNRSASKAKK